MGEWKKYLWLLPALLCLTVVAAGTFAAAQGEPDQALYDTDAVKLQWERELRELILGVEGAGEVKVMLTVDTMPRRYYAKDVSTDYDSDGSGRSQSVTVLTGEYSSGRTPVLLYEELPSVRGVAVVCSGGADAEVALRIRELVMSLFDLDAHEVCVTY